jgi:DNA (cytosine-5)-methyltransferase 1
MAHPGQAVNLSMPNSRSRRGRVSDVSPTLDTGMWIYTVEVDGRLRRLTPKECERLQAFPDDWTKLDMGGGEISDRQRYKLLGNAVTTNVIQSVFERIFASSV